MATIVRGTDVPQGKLKIATVSRTIPLGDSTVYTPYEQSQLVIDPTGLFNEKHAYAVDCLIGPFGDWREEIRLSSSPSRRETDLNRTTSLIRIHEGRAEYETRRKLE